MNVTDKIKFNRLSIFVFMVKINKKLNVIS